MNNVCTYVSLAAHLNAKNDHSACYCNGFLFDHSKRTRLVVPSERKYLELRERFALVSSYIDSETIYIVGIHICLIIIGVVSRQPNDILCNIYLLTYIVYIVFIKHIPNDRCI